LQNAADSAALAGCARLIEPNSTLAISTMQRGSGSQYFALLDSATADAVAEAQRYGGLHKGAGVGLVINASDVELGYIADPAASPTTPEGQFQTGGSAPFPNSVRATARRDDQTSTGAFGLFFTRVFGVHSAQRSATATATLRGGTINGFKGSGSGLLPIAMHKSVYDWLMGASALLPAGVVDQDHFKVTIGESKPPSNVTRVADGRKEARVYPDPSGTDTSGNFGLVNLNNDPNSNANDIDGWIRTGPSEGQLASWGSNGLRATADAPLAMSGQTGLQATQEDALRSIIGEPRIMPVFTTTQGPGSNATFTVIGFVAVVVVDVELSGRPADKRLVVQIMRAIDPTAVIESSTSSGSSSFIFQGISLSR
jgi:hypothetical protein